MKKSIKELSCDDLGRKVRFVASDGDVNTGVLESYNFNLFGERPGGGLKIGNSHISLDGDDLDGSLEFLEEDA